ncbi:CHAT domain-containing protein [Leptolyngbya sp. FACHB-16]|uniref:CHAT domain-containing protein n=1 Tax=unclassified Leptolyngbya TaxID=2650499 RepID=UPI00168653CF|nr:CHAT domain-containing protein [Leptolyngbya sp. FACHB-16]MBD2154032.1 CHAT domain-containing protein [Leptolyngbya sp. FACHB-16]
MMSLMHRRSLSISVSLLFLLLASAPLLAQSITSAGDDTGTQVLQEGERYTITGGTRARENLFHSFERLGLDADEIATFLAQPDIENILGRVTGGDASIINGLLQVQGGSANLYLMNPAGIVFGPNARLDVSGSFFATTATGIGFGDRWFNASGENTYGDLIDTPDSFAFSLINGGAIANFADLAVQPGESLSLLGSTVTNTGNLSAPGGTITLAAVPGGNRVRLSQAGSLLSLELDAPDGTWDMTLNPVALTPLSLPQLLTGGNVGTVSQLTVNSDGSVRLHGADVPVQDGTTLVAGTLNAAGTAAAGIHVLGDRVALLNATLDASGTNGGGTIRIGGDYQGSGSVFNASRTYVSQGSSLAADALNSGPGGRVILWADDTTYFAGTISAQGGSLSGNGGFVEVSGAQDLVFRGTTDLRAPQGLLGTLLLDPTNIVIVSGTGGADDGQLDADVPAGELAGLILAGQDADAYTISEAALEALDGNANVVLEATNDITINPLADGFLTFAAGTGTITLTADADGSGVGSFIMQNATNTLQALGRSLTITGAGISAGNIDLGDSTVAPAGAITLVANNGNMTVGSINTAANDDFPGDFNYLNAGDVTLLAPNGSITAGNINASTYITTRFSGDGGTVRVSARDTVQTGTINTLSGGGFGGTITLESSNGSLSTGLLSSLSFADGGGRDITLTANNGSITTGAITAYGNTTRVGGAVNLTTAIGTITTGTIETDNNDILLRGDVVLNRDISLTNRNSTGAIELSGSFNGNYALTVDAGAGAVTFREAIGSTVPLGNLVINSTGTTQFGSTVNAASIQTNAGGATQLNGDVTTSASTGQNYGDALTLVGDIRLTGSEIDLGSTVSGSGNLTLQTFEENGAIALGGTDNNTVALDLTTTELAQIQPGFRSITIAGANGTGTITLNDTSALGRTPTLLRGFSTLVGPELETTWRITGRNQGQVSGLNFAAISTLQGGRGDDTFQFNTGETFVGSIAAGLGRLRLAGMTVNLDNPSVDYDISASGPVVIEAAQGIQVGGIEASGSAGPGQRVTLTSRNGSITTGDITTAGTTGGDVTLRAETAITTGAIDASGRIGNGGNVTLDPIGDVQVGWINAEGGDNGIGGTVDITAGRFFRATDSFSNRNGQQASISTAGGFGGGAITIRHGGNGSIPFFIDDDFGDNGSRAAITNGTDTFDVGSYFFNSATRGTVSILTNNLPDLEEPEPPVCEANCGATEEGLPPVNEETPVDIPTVVEARAMLLNLAEQTGIPPALIYISFVSPEIQLPNGFADREAIASHQFTDYLEQGNPTNTPLLTVQPSDTDELELMLVLPNGDIVRQRVAGVTRSMVSQIRRQLVNEITAPNRFRSNRYLASAQQLYQWLIAPLEDELASQNIGNLAFILDSGLRSIPLSVLHDGHQFLIERYSIGLMPSLSLTDTHYQDLRNVPVLAMGASEFDTLLPLPAVPTELTVVTSAVPNSIFYLNQNFTQANLLKTRYERPYSIVHLATHADFQTGGLQNSYIQFGDRRLPLNDLRQLRLNEPPVELLVLSACKTALGDDQAELGFGGLAVQAGVRSVLASLWYVSDTGTLGFMSEFYRQLQESPTRSEALRETQLSMLRGETRLEDGQLITPHGVTPLSPGLVGTNDIDLSHPYFWASFTMIGSPW